MHHQPPQAAEAPRAERDMMDLPAEELLIVGAMRAWVAPHLTPDAPHPDWRALFHRAGLAAAAAAGFDGLMNALGGHATRMLEVRCCACPQLGPDEADMLRLFAALQGGDIGSALGVLTAWLPFDVVELGLEPAQQCAALLAEHGLRLVPPPIEVAGSRGRTIQLQ